MIIFSPKHNRKCRLQKYFFLLHHLICGSYHSSLCYTLYGRSIKWNFISNKYNCGIIIRLYTTYVPFLNGCYFLFFVKLSLSSHSMVVIIQWYALIKNIFSICIHLWNCDAENKNIYIHNEESFNLLPSHIYLFLGYSELFF